MQKRGEYKLVMWIMSTVAALVIGGMMVHYGVAWAGDEEFRMVYFTADGAYMMDTLFAVPGNVQVNYSHDLSKYRMEISDSRFYLYKDGTNKSMRFLNSKSKIIDLNPIEKNYYTKGELISLGKKTPIGTYECPNTKINITRPSLLLDPIFSDNAEENHLMHSLLTVFTLQQNSANFAYTTFTRQLSSNPSLQKRTAMVDKNIDFTLTAGFTISEEHYVIAHASPENVEMNSKIACHIMNRIANAFPELNGSAIIMDNKPIAGKSIYMEFMAPNARESEFALKRTALQKAILEGMTDAFQ